MMKMKTLQLLAVALLGLIATTSFAADTALPASFETKYVKSGEALLQVRVVGKGAPILLVRDSPAELRILRRS